MVTQLYPVLVLLHRGAEGKREMLKYCTSLPLYR